MQLSLYVFHLCEHQGAVSFFLTQPYVESAANIIVTSVIYLPCVRKHTHAHKNVVEVRYTRCVMVVRVQEADTWSGNTRFFVFVDEKISNFFLLEAVRLARF